MLRSCNGTMMKEESSICQWCGSDDVRIWKNQVKVINAQTDAPYTLYGCQQCGNLCLISHWEHRCSLYRALEHRRFLLPSTYVIIYPVACAWCGRSEHMEPAEINAIIANPMSNRHRYDVYACYGCDHYTAVLYSGEICTYQAIPDRFYDTLYYIRDHDESLPADIRKQVTGKSNTSFNIT